MFTADSREAIRQRLLARARADDRVVAAAITGSAAGGREDAWSDVDLAFAVAGGSDRDAVMKDWTRYIEDTWVVAHHWDLPAGASLFRVFLLRDALEVDISFTPAAAFGSYTPTFRPVFGSHRDLPPPPGPDPRGLIGIGWHHALHAAFCIARGQPWQAVHLISVVRDHTITLACLRLGLPTSRAKGADELPADLRAQLLPTLVASLAAAELLRSLSASVDAFAGEVGRRDPALAERVAAALDEAIRQMAGE